jgi:putative phosphoribosyl transferase
MLKFRDRSEAGRMLAAKLTHLKSHSDLIVLALPRGGVPIAYEVAQALDAPMDVFLVRKLGVPGHEELAMGAITLSGRVLNNSVIQGFNVSPEALERVVFKEQQELLRRHERYRANKGPLEVSNRTVVVVDDGLATGATMRAAISALRGMHPAYIVLAVPVAPVSATRQFSMLADEFISLIQPHDFFGVGQWYTHFPQLNDSEVIDLLALNELTQSAKMEA